MDRMINSEKLAYDDVLLKPQMSFIESRESIDVSTDIGAGVVLQTPIISSNMDTITGIKMAKMMADVGGLGLFHRNDSDLSKYKEYVKDWNTTHSDHLLAFSVGSVNRPKEKDRIHAVLDLLSEQNKGLICVDIAHGHSENMRNTLRYLRNVCKYNGHLMAGAVCTQEGAQMMVDEGVDSIRVGVGPGSCCSTRIKTGCGYPQFSAVFECSQVVGANVIADGGIREPGDAAKALAAGAKAVMVGGVLAGTDCVPGWDEAMKQWNASGGWHKPKIPFRGMASNDAKMYGGLEQGYEEGVSTLVKIGDDGSTKDVIVKMIDGIKSSMSYCNAQNLIQFRSGAVFIKVSSGVIHENHPHILSRI